MGPAVVVAHAADPRLRDRPARVWRHFRRLRRNCAKGRRPEAAGAGSTQAPRRDGRCGCGGRTLFGVNKYLESAPSPLAGAADAILTVSEDAERGQIERLKAWRESRD